MDRILFLQRTAGNQAVSRLMRSRSLQAKFKIGQPGDKYEREADRVADAVMRMPEPGVQRPVEPEEKEEGKQPRKPADSLNPQQWIKIKTKHHKRRQPLQVAVTSGEMAVLKSAAQAAAKLFDVSLQRSVPDYKKFPMMVWLTEEIDDPPGWSMARLTLYKKLTIELKKEVPAQAVDDVALRLVSSYKPHYANLLRATLLINNLAKFPTLFRAHFKKVLHVFKKVNLLGPVFSNWQRARLIEYFHDNKIPEGLFTSSLATGKLLPHQRILLAAQILAAGERDVKNSKALKVRGDKWDLDPHVKAKYCGHWVKLVWNYAGVNPADDPAREWVVGPTGRISFGGGKRATIYQGRRRFSLEKFRAHQRGYHQALLTAVFDSVIPYLRPGLLSIATRLVYRVVNDAHEQRMKAEQAYAEAKVAFDAIKRSRRNKAWYRIRYASWKAWRERRLAHRRLRAAEKDRKKVLALFSKPKVGRYLKRLGLSVLAKLANNGHFQKLYKQLGFGERAKIAKKWRRREGWGFNIFNSIRPGDHLWYYVANRSRSGDHSVIFVKWEKNETKTGRTKSGQKVYFRRALIYNQWSNKPPSGGVFGRWYLGFPDAEAVYDKKGKRIARRVSSVTAVFRPKKSKHGKVGPPRTLQQLLHFDHHKANRANLRKLEHLTRRRRPQKIDLAKLAAYLRTKTSELLKHPNLTTLEPAQRKLCEQIIQQQSGATIDNISNLVALYQKLLGPISYAQKKRGKGYKVNGKLNWSQLGLKTRALREPLESSLGGAESWLAFIVKEDWGRRFHLDLAIEYNRTFMEKQGIPHTKLSQLVALVAGNVAERLKRPSTRVRRKPFKLLLLKHYYKQHHKAAEGLTSLSIMIALWQFLRGRTVDGWVSRYSRIVSAAKLKTLK